MGFFLLLCLAGAGLLVAAGVMAVRALFFLVLLPFRLLFGLVLFPLWLVRTALKIVGAAIVLPIVAVAGGIALIAVVAAAVLALVVPLLPILLVGVALYFIIRAITRRPVAA
jgi:hypothetical protein